MCASTLYFSPPDLLNSNSTPCTQIYLLYYHVLFTCTPKPFPSSVSCIFWYLLLATSRKRSLNETQCAKILGPSIKKNKMAGWMGVRYWILKYVKLCQLTDTQSNVFSFVPKMKLISERRRCGKFIGIL